MLVGDRIAVGLEVEVSLHVAHPERHFRAVVRMKRQRRECRQLLFQEEFQRRSAGRLVQMQVAFLREPPSRATSKVFQILELTAAQEVSLHVLEGALDLTLGLGSAALADDGTIPVVGNEGGEGGMDQRAPRLPAQHHGFLAVVEALGGGALEVGEGVPMTADQGEEVAPRGEVYELAPGEAQDVGEALHLLFSRLQEVDGIGAPVHLPLHTGIGLEADHRLFLGQCSAFAQPVPEDADAPPIPCVAQLLQEPDTGDPGELLQKTRERLVEGVELAGARRLLPGTLQNVVPLVTEALVPSQDAPHHVAADAEVSRERPD